MEQESYNPVDRGLKQLADEELKPFHYERMMAGVRSKNERISPIMNITRKTALISVAFAVIVLAMVLIPATYSMKVGDLVTAEFAVDVNIPKGGASPAVMPDLDNVMKAVEGIEGVVNRNLNINNGNAELVMTFVDRDIKDVEPEIRAALAGVVDKNATISLRSEEITKPVGGNALAAVTNGRVCIGVEGPTDEELENTLRAAFASQGLQLTEVDVKTEHMGDGEIRREIRIGAVGADEGALEDCEGAAGVALEAIEINMDQDGQVRIIKKYIDGDDEKISP
ncbi:MAG: hypothetical protein HN356_08075 [Calditrichaeota bacterium]|nr:hypothetical protein [Calditrichota bacterium]MBT7788801.1 hypothetical protein [Calditrichota bacterium]